MQKRQLAGVLFLAMAGLWAGSSAQPGQRGATPPAGALPESDVVIGSGSFSPIVSDLDQSLAFYRDIFGITSTAPAPAFSNSDTALLNFLGVPKGQVRVSQVPIPGTNPPMNVELVDFKDVDRKPIHPRLQDPGATRLILLVRDVAAIFARLRAKKVPVVSVSASILAGGAPSGFGDKTVTKGVIVSDPDGFSIELLQPNPLPQTTSAVSGDFLGARLGLTVENMDQSLKVYRDLLRFQIVQDEQFKPDFGFGSLFSNLMGLSPTSFRRVVAGIPGSTLQWVLVEFHTVRDGNSPPKPIGARIQDPGSTRVQLRVRDTEATIASLKAAGATLITTGTDGGPINMNGLKLGIVRDPNNLFLLIFQSGAPRG